MTTWRNQKVSEVVKESRVPYTPISTEQLPYIGLEHIEEASLKLNSIGTSDEAGSQKKKFYKGDILYGSLRPYFRKVVKPNFDGVCSTDITVLKPKESVDGDYLFYLVANLEFINKASMAANGTKMPRAGWKIVKDFVFNIPEQEIRAKIGSMLSAYDALIENNEKRIKILEEMAQRLYNEWFVRFKFPGHEKVKMIESGTEYGMIPGGWEVKKYDELFNIKYGKNLPTTKLQNLGYPVYGAGGIIGFFSEKNVSERTVLVTCRGNGSGTVWRTYGDGFITNNSLYIQAKNTKIQFEFIYNCTRNNNVLSAVSGSAQPQVTIDSINFVKAILPDVEIITKYQNMVKNLYSEGDLLRYFNTNLSKTRDLLIPQLVTGRRKLN